MTRFIADQGSVWMTGRDGPIKLTDASVEQLLDVFDREEAVKRFNELYEAHQAVGGLSRCTSLRAA